MDGVSARSKGLMNFSRFLVVLLLLTLGCKSVYYATCFMNRLIFREVLECASPLALWHQQ